MMKSVTFEGTTPTGLYDLTVQVPNGTMILSSARIDILLATPTDYASIPKSISLEIGTVVGSQYVIDNNVAANYFKVILENNIITIGANTYLSSVTYPNTSFKMNGDLNKQCVFSVRDQNGVLLDSTILKFWSFHFTCF